MDYVNKYCPNCGRVLIDGTCPACGYDDKENYHSHGDNVHHFEGDPHHLNGRHFHGHHGHYAPFYDDHADYKTNAPSYYDYLARRNKFLAWVEKLINRLFRRNIKVEDTPTIDLTKKGDWISEDNCDNYSDVITLTARVVFSKATENRTYSHLKPTTYKIPNGSKEKPDGVWSPDYEAVLQSINTEIGNLWNEVNNQGDQITNITNAMQKIIDNLYNSGAINNNTWNFDFNTGRNIATGNINHFGGTQDGSAFIRTNKGSTENDTTIGV